MIKQGSSQIALVCCQVSFKIGHALSITIHEIHDSCTVLATKGWKYPKPHEFSGFAYQKKPKKNTQKTFSGTSKKIILENVSSLLVDSKVRICHDSRPLGIGNHLQRSKCPGHYIDLGVIKFDTKNAANLEAKRPLYHHPSYLSPLAYSLDCQRSSPKNVGHSTKARRIDFEK